MKKIIFLVVVCSFMQIVAYSQKPKEKPVVATRWTIEKAKQWGKANGWLRGSNFNPSTAINQLETWQAESSSI